MIELLLQFRDSFELNLLFLFEHLNTARQVSDFSAERRLAAVALAVLLTTRKKTMTRRK